MKRNSYLFGLFLLCNCFTANGQNLLRNASFEEHAEQKCMNCDLGGGKYPGIVYHWDNAGWGCGLLDKNIKGSYNNEYFENPFNKLSPKDGKAMISMWYLPNCGGCVHEGATYLSARTTKPMEVGHLYEVSFWVYIESKKWSDPDWAKHIGITLLPQNLKMHGLGWHNGPLIFPSLPIDTVLYDSWYPVKWRIRPLCTSNYLMIGVFEDQHWGQKRKGPDVQYFLDQVSVTEIPSVSAVSDSSIYYCSRYDPVSLGIPPQMDNQSLLFQNDASALTEAHKTVLDSFAEFAKKYPDLVFELSGHTDSIGSKNQQLSEARVQSVFQYLTEIKQLPDFRFIKLAMGSKEQARSNSTEAGRAMNRRVEIRQSNLDLPNIFYRKALKAVEQERYPEAFSFLDKWVKKLHPSVGTGMIVQFDPRFEVLHQDKRWAALNQKIRNKFSKIKYAGSAFQLDSMRLDDLSASGDLTSMGYFSGLNALSGFHPEMDSVRFDMEPLPMSIIQKKHAQHFAALLPILKKTGWPKKSEFGESACNSAFSVLLNSNNVAEYQRWLPAIKKSCEEGETPWIFYAKLYDHCNLALGKPQRYVTVVGMEDGDLWVKPWEGDENSVNEWRAKIGLPLLSYEVAEAMRRIKERP